MPTFELGVTSELLQRRVPIPARDGTVLRATVYRPDDNERHPVLLVRTPYGEAMTRTVPVQPALDAGFAVVIQDCRGTGESDGDFVPFAPRPTMGSIRSPGALRSHGRMGQSACTGRRTRAWCSLPQPGGRPRP